MTDIRASSLPLALASIDAAAASMREDVYKKVRAMMIAYDSVWRGKHVAETLETEQQFELPIINPETNHPSRTFRMGGKKDGKFKSADGEIFLVEHKTCSEEISDPSSSYWKRLTIDSQISHYMLAEHLEGNKIEGVMYDVIRKPMLKLKKNQTPDEYEQELIDCMTAEPGKYFQRRVVNRLDFEVLEYANELWDTGREIAETRKNGRNYRNSDACVHFGRTCEYLGLCTGTDTEAQFNTLAQVHRELEGELEKGGRDILTVSRIRAFMRCRRYHHYRYEKGLVKPEGEEGDSESLSVGTVFHAALAVWWNGFKEENKKEKEGKEDANCNDTAQAAD